jgi:hypothetical protein
MIVRQTVNAAIHFAGGALLGASLAVAGAALLAAARHRREPDGHEPLRAPSGEPPAPAAPEPAPPREV